MLSVNGFSFYSPNILSNGFSSYSPTILSNAFSSYSPNIWLNAFGSYSPNILLSAFSSYRPKILSNTFSSYSPNILSLSEELKALMLDLPIAADPYIYFVESVGQDKPVHSCRLILPCTIHCSVMNLCERNSIQCHLTIGNMLV